MPEQFEALRHHCHDDRPVQDLQLLLELSWTMLPLAPAPTPAPQASVTAMERRHPRASPHVGSALPKPENASSSAVYP